jgi:uncharacterized membrane protein YbhN (UPF0104 family)
MSKKTIAVALKFGVSGALIWFLFTTKINLDATIVRVEEAKTGYLALAVAVFLFQILICAFRWRSVLLAIRSDMDFKTVFRLFYIGAFFNQTLPSSVGGDAVRMYKAYRCGQTLSQAVNGVMLERAATVIALVLVVIAVQPFFLPGVDVATAEMMGSGVAVVGVVMAAGLGLLLVLDRVLGFLPHAVSGWRLARGLAALASDARLVFLVPGRAVRVFGWSAAGHVNVTFGVFLIAQALGLNITFIDSLALVPPVLLVMTVPISIAGWGVREMAMVTMFGLIGVPKEGAMAMSLLFGLAAALTSLPGGVFWLTGGERAADMTIPKDPEDKTAAN